MKSGNKRLFRFFFMVVLIFSTYHLVRDVLQTFEIQNLFTNILHRPHLWCKSYCNFVTYPLDLLGIIGSLFVLKKSKPGTIGTIIILSLPLWLFAALLPQFNSFSENNQKQAEINTPEMIFKNQSLVQLIPEQYSTVSRF